MRIVGCEFLHFFQAVAGVVFQKMLFNLKVQTQKSARVRASLACWCAAYLRPSRFLLM